MTAVDAMRALVGGDDLLLPRMRLRLQGHRLERHYLPPDARRPEDGVWVQAHLTLAEFIAGCDAAAVSGQRLP